MPTDLQARGIWYEKSRRRFRVRLYAGTAVFHLSYHRTLEDAVAARDAALASRDRRALVPVLNTAWQKLACLLGIENIDPEDEYLMYDLLTVDRFIQLYFDAASAPKTRTVWRWIRTGRLPAQRIGRRYYIHKDDAARFVSSAQPAEVYA